MSTINLRNVTSEQQLAIFEKSNPELKDLLSIYPEDQIERLIDNKSKLMKIINVLNKDIVTSSTISSIIMNCQETCPFRDVCVFVKNELAPYGYPCPVEKKIISQLEGDIVISLEIDRNDPIEMELLWDLIDAKILDMRASGALKDGSLIQIVEQKLNGSTNTREERSPTLELKLDLKRLKHSIIDSFVATRRAKKKYGMQSDVNSIEQMILAAAARSQENE